MGRAAPAGSFTAISAAPDTACAIRTSGAIECWGRTITESNSERWGQLHAPEGSYTAVSAGTGHSCAIREGGAIECWGDNEHGQATPPTD